MISLGGDGEEATTRPPRVVEIEVLVENIRTVEVFLRCQPQVVMGMGIFWQGVSVSEIQSTCVLLRVPQEEWLDVLDGVQHMAHVVATIRNERSAKK